MRHQHDLGVGGHGHAARTEWPDAGNGAEQCRLAGAGRSGDENARSGGKYDVLGGNDRLAVGQPNIEVIGRKSSSAAADYFDRRRCFCGRASCFDRILES